MNAGRKALFLAGQLGLMMQARFFFQWIIKYATSEQQDNIGVALF